MYNIALMSAIQYPMTKCQLLKLYSIITKLEHSIAKLLSAEWPTQKIVCIF